MKSIKNFYILVITILLLVNISSCKNSKKVDNESYSTILEAYQNNRENPELLENLIGEELLNWDDFQRVIDLFEQNKDLLDDRVMSRIYYATALCQKAGESDSPSDQLKFIRKGIGEFDLLLEDYPDEGRVYIWKTITYSNFPDILGVNEIVVDSIDYINSKINSGEWTFVEAELRLLSISYVHIAIEYKKKEYLTLALDQIKQDGFLEDSEILKLIETAKKVIK